MKKQTFYKNLFIWVRRFRNRKGYGVHSPFAFRLVTEVIYAKNQYYDFALLKDLVLNIKTSDSKQWRNSLDPLSIYELLYRLVNEVKATTILEVGLLNGVSSAYLNMCRKSAKHIVLNKNSELSPFISSFFINNGIDVENKDGDVLSMLPAALLELNTVDFLLLRAADYSVSDIQTVFEQCLTKSTNNSLFVVQDIYASKAISRWWKTLVKDERLGITFDLYHVGLVFFDKTKIKQHYVVNF